MKLFFQWPGEMGVFQTVWQMKALANASFVNPWIRERAALSIEGCGKNPKCHHATLQNFVTSIVNYVKDPKHVEALHHPVSFYEYRIRKGEKVWGDCDDMATYLATLLKSIGHSPAFGVVGQQNAFHHVFVICESEWLDPTMGLGRYPENPGRSIRVPV